MEKICEGGSVMAVEFELKYRATEPLLALLRRDLPGEEQLLQMHTTYYDTPSGALSARRWTLRCRLENDVRICTLKTPTDGIGRREWETECDDIQKALRILCKLGAPEEALLLSREGLVPICGARFTRVAKTLTLGDCVLELALDEGVLTGGGQEIPLCEVELELKQGEPAACVAYAKMLQQVYSLVPEEKSKFRRALELYRGEI